MTRIGQYGPTLLLYRYCVMWQNSVGHWPKDVDRWRNLRVGSEIVPYLRPIHALAAPYPRLFLCLTIQLGRLAQRR
jgi:hypothetical protein